MVSRRVLALAVALVVLTAGCFGVTAPEHPPGAASSLGSTPVATAGDSASAPAEPPNLPEAPSAPPDPASDRLGWEEGYWYNETIAMDRRDGLNDSELAAVVSRAMARVEQIRTLEFDQRVPVRVISRAAFAANRTGRTYGPKTRLHQNAKWEATFVVNESTNALATRDSNAAVAVEGFYAIGQERIVIVSENTTAPELNEITLAQELFHALQDQIFDAFEAPWYPGNTTEAHNAADGVIEGDGNYVDYLYQRRCEAAWDCLVPRSNGSDGGGGDLNVGMFAVTYHPYSSGPAFVKRLRERDGWGAVDDLYENPFQSTEQLIHPDKYGEDPPATLRIDHTASNGWRVLDMGDGRINHGTFGEAGLAVMMWYPSFVETAKGREPATVIANYSGFFNEAADGSGLPAIGPYNYSFPVTDGWEADRLVPYVREDSASTNQTGYVWKLRWETRADASEFRAGYERLLEYHGARAVSDSRDTFRIPEGNEFADAFYVGQDGRTITIVNAPTVDALTDVHAAVGS